MHALAKLLTVEQRSDARNIARQSMLEAKGDPVPARAIARFKIKAWKKSRCESGTGSMIMIITAAAIMLKLIYYAIKIWKELNYSDPPLTPVSGEPFGLE